MYRAPKIGRWIPLLVCAFALAGIAILPANGRAGEPNLFAGPVPTPAPDPPPDPVGAGDPDSPTSPRASLAARGAGKGAANVAVTTGVGDARGTEWLFRIRIALQAFRVIVLR